MNVDMNALHCSPILYNLSVACNYALTKASLTLHYKPPIVSPMIKTGPSRSPSAATPFSRLQRIHVTREQDQPHQVSIEDEILRIRGEEGFQRHTLDIVLRSYAIP